MQMHIAKHRHRHDEGFPDLYPFILSDDHPMIDEEYVIKNSSIDFEPGRDDESIEIGNPIPVPVPLLDRLNGVAIVAYNQTFSASEILEKATDDDLILALGDMADSLIQEGVL